MMEVKEPMILPLAAPTLPRQAVHKQYVDDVAAGGGGGNYLPLTGGTLTGDLVLDGNTDGSYWRVIKSMPGDELDIATDYLYLYTFDQISTPGNSSGSVNVYSGNVAGSAGSGSVSVQSGSVEAGVAGGVSLQGGYATTGQAGSAGLSGGNANGAGGVAGDVVLAAGTGSNGATDGLVKILTPLQATGFSQANPPTTADIPAQTFAVWKSQSDGSVMLYFNDGGIMKSVALT